MFLENMIIDNQVQQEEVYNQSLLLINKGAALPIFYKDELSLTAYKTTKVDKKNGINRLPTTGLELMNEEQFRNRLDSQTQERLQTRSKTSTLYAKQKGEAVSIDDFGLIKVLGRGAYGKVNLYFTYPYLRDGIHYVIFNIFLYFQ